MNKLNINVLWTKSIDCKLILQNPLRNVGFAGTTTARGIPAFSSG